MKHVLLNGNGERIVVDMKVDDCLYQSPVNPPNTGTAYTRGADLYAHKAKSGKVYFYLHHWSLWQGEEGGLRLLTKEETENFLTDKMALTGYGAPSDGEVERWAEFDLNVLTETA